MALLVECPKCRKRNSTKLGKCSCGVNLKKQGNKNYWIEFYDEIGKRRRERIGPSRAAAEQRLRMVLKLRTEGRHIDRDLSVRITLGELCRWYSSLPEVCAKASYVRDMCSIKNLLRILGENTKIRDLTTGRVEGYRQYRLSEQSPRRLGMQTTPSTVNKEVICLKTILNRAVRHERLDVNPIRDMKKLTENNTRTQILKFDEFGRLCDACPEYLRPLIMTAFYSGMRKSEIVFLTWEELDLKQGFIRLSADRTKTKIARSIPLHPELKKMFSRIPRGLYTNRIFLKDGRPFEDFKKSFRSACRKAGLNNFTFHDLRHCAINNLRLAGNDYFKIMAVSGHKTVAVFKRYNLVTEEELSRIVWTKREEDANDADGHQYGH